MTSKVLVLGARGYVGQRVVAALAASGVAQPLAGGRRAGPGVDVVLDATDAQALASALPQVDAVVNCVAGSPQAIVANAQALVQALQQVPVRLVHFSSMAVYGAVEGRVDESQPLAGGVGDYSAAKVQAEQLLAAVPDRIVLRPGCIYGPGSPQWTDRIAALLRAHRIGDLGEHGDGCSNLVHVDDVAQAVVAALRLPGPVQGSYNLAMGQAPNWNDYFLAMARALGAVPLSRIGARRLKIETRLAAPALKILEIAAGRAGLRLRLPPPIPPSLVRLWGQDIRLDSSAAERDLGLSWRALAESVPDSVAGRDGTA